MIQNAILIGISTAVLMSGAPALAQDVLQGSDAFGGYTANEPGTRRLITPDDLPPPNAAESASNPSEIIAMPEGAALETLDGFTAELVASGIENPRVLRFAPNGDLFVANSAAGQLLVFPAAPGNSIGQKQIFASGLNRPYGIAFYPLGDDPEWIYVGESDGIVRFPYTHGDIEASAEPEVIVSGIPSEHHWTRDVVFSPDGGTVYFAVGSGSNVGENMPPEPAGGLDAWISEHALGESWGPEERRATVLAYNPDGSNERVLASGLRNCSGMTIQPETGELWCVVNERDAIGDNLPPDYATSVEPGAFYGWPWYYIGDNEDPRLAGARPDLADDVTVPDVLFQAHSAPLNIAFKEDDSWGEEFAGDAFVAMHGSWNRGTRTGYKLVRLEMEDGEPTGVYEDFLTGFVTENGQVWGRPVGVTFGPDGSLYFSEDGNGTIWRVSRR